MYDEILSSIGRTPLVKLSRVFGDCDFRLFAKLEGFNPGGSIKDRAAMNIINRALEAGVIGPNTTIIESSSGNMGIGLAQVCAYHKMRFICVIDPKTTQANIQILRAYGAEIDYVSEPDPVTGEFLKARIDRVRQLIDTIPDSYCPDQYSNPDNFRAHYQTMAEITSELNGDVDFLFCATSTCGTMRGCSEYVHDRELKTNIIAVDAVGSVIFGGRSAKRLIPGHGAAVRPKLHRPDLTARCVHVTDLECVVGCRRLVREEAILAGGSSGAVLMAIEHLKSELPPGSSCVAIFPDRGERYLDTIYSDRWVAANLGQICETCAEWSSYFTPALTVEPAIAASFNLACLEHAK
jgi:2,3-diaminopropionate biosynthesis protein SbnA